jgi:general secretion pathway protein I
MMGFANNRSATMRGLTLIEVLIALAIVGIAMTAVIKATSQNIRATNYLQNKTMALGVAKQIMSEIQTGILKLPDHREPFKNKTTLLGREWYWLASQEMTPNKRIKNIQVKVYETENEDETETVTPLINIESYIYHAE